RPLQPPGSDLTQPQVSPLRVLRHQVLRPRTLVPVSIALAALVFTFRTPKVVSATAIWTELSDANPLLLLVAIGIFYLTFPIRALRWRPFAPHSRSVGSASVQPITPGGLGVTAPGMALVLGSIGVAAAGASAIALLNRCVNYLSPVLAAAVPLIVRQ